MEDLEESGTRKKKQKIEAESTRLIWKLLAGVLGKWFGVF